MLRPEHLEGYSAEEIDNRLIPFKKRNFKELQQEESKIKVIIALTPRFLVLEPPKYFDLDS